MTSMVDLFFEVISMMGMRGYDILPFQFLIDSKMISERVLQRGETPDIISEAALLSFLVNYRTENFMIDPSLFNEGNINFSTIFNHSYNGLRTLVLICNDDSMTTSKDTLVSYINKYMKRITELKTNGLSSDPFIRDNKVSAIFIINGTVSSYCKPFLDELSIIEILTYDNIMSRCYDSCLQSHITTIPKEIKVGMLSQIGLSSNKIPSIKKKNDIMCQVLGLQQGNLLVARRRKISSEETVTNAVFVREIK